ncbi:MAG: Tab2/Atab2 family RNA-binding protein, partial [Planktothrix sp.]|uniref:Tab2/Atab2 family RNA-binding protein n=1 Tax=Planktothrix sp. TaxID=3088171 RepID=UPI0038D4161E
TQFCPSNQVNSVWLKQAIETAISEVSTPPSRIRFFLLRPAGGDYKNRVPKWLISLMVRFYCIKFTLLLMLE